MEFYRLKIVLLLTFGFLFASILGYFTQRIKLSPILGYLLAGYLIGPYSPGFRADLEVSEQLAEIGVILMMFGVGLHFKWEELSSVKRIAIPGAIGQTLVSAVIGCLLMYSLGWSIESGLVIGVAIGVASTVVLVRVLSDNNLLNTPQGHVAIGWLIVEDILTVAALIMLPLFTHSTQSEGLIFQTLALSVGGIVLKLLVLGIIVFTLGRKVVTYILNSVSRVRSHELFTITVLALTFTIATGSSLVFGTSIALGAFLAGMVIGRTDLRHQALANSLALKDVFVVIFFLSIGMLFNPTIIITSPLAFLGILATVLLVKPLAAYLIVVGMRYPLKTALTVAVALGQIGEFSFILAEESSRLKILPDDGYDLIVACALVAIAANPIFFRFIDLAYGAIERKAQNPVPDPYAGLFWENPPKAIIAGCGPLGQATLRTLEKLAYASIVIDRNVDIVAKLNTEYVHAIYGDASHEEILQVAHINTAGLLAITVSESETAIAIIRAARRLNPNIQILSYAQCRGDEVLLKHESVTVVSCEEEMIKAFSHAVYKLTDSYSRGFPHTHV